MKREMKQTSIKVDVKSTNKILNIPNSVIQSLKIESIELGYRSVSEYMVYLLSTSAVEAAGSRNKRVEDRIKKLLKKK
jgi:hypothetical protein